MNAFFLVSAIFFSLDDPRTARAISPSNEERGSTLNCNAALQYYLAFLNSPTSERLPPEEKKLLENVETCSLDNSQIQSLLNRFSESLDHLRLGSKCRRCDWGIDLRFHEDPYGFLPFGSETTINISRGACLRAKHSFSRGKFQEGLDDLIDTLILARRFGQSGVILGKSWQSLSEGPVIQVATPYLSAISATPSLREFELKLSNLPHTSSLSSLILKEKEAYVGWIRKGNSKLIKAVVEDRLYKDDENVKKFTLALLGVDEARIPKVCEATSVIFDRAAKIVTLPPEQCETEEKKLNEELRKVLESDLKKVLEGKDNNPIEKAFALMLLPPLGKSRQLEVETQVRFALFQAAIAVLLRGEKELEKTQDPLGGAPFRLQKFDRRFELVSKLKDKDGKPIKITIPKK